MLQLTVKRTTCLCLQHRHVETCGKSCSTPWKSEHLSAWCNTVSCFPSYPQTQNKTTPAKELLKCDMKGVHRHTTRFQNSFTPLLETLWKVICVSSGYWNLVFQSQPPLLFRFCFSFPNSRVVNDDTLITQWMPAVSVRFRFAESRRWSLTVSQVPQWGNKLPALSMKITPWQFNAESL